MDLKIRPRRLRYGENLRKMVRETRMDPSALIYPLFVREGNGIVEEINAMPGQYRYSVDTMGQKLESLLDAGVTSVMFFGIPDHAALFQIDNHTRLRIYKARSRPR